MAIIAPCPAHATQCARAGAAQFRRHPGPFLGPLPCDGGASHVRCVFQRRHIGSRSNAATPGVFIIAVITILVWAATGPLFGYSDTWQLIINTGTTIITFLIVFLIQNTQNRDTAAIQLKLDELDTGPTQSARNRMLCIEDLTEDELKNVKATFASLVTPAERAIGHGS